MNWITRLSILAVLIVAAPASSSAEDKQPAPPPAANGQKAPASPAGSLISANGFTCSMMEGQAQCQGAFKDIDKDLQVGAKGGGSILVQVKKGDKLYTYASQTGCLCTQKKDEISCQNAHGKQNKFKGDKMKDDAASFCSGKK